ncbi:serine hydrolase domain-containing protein [Maribacter antarcticus]|uniref:serine hydrolase domain-containing protein n=1 Tax=Maribacter antarcticus TaxID=505250 RepID=UPI00056B1134|nr:serine hydrolase domain-containing protein [Maribacter antarcticus]
MANPILKYLKNIVTSKRILGNDNNLNALVKADSLLQGLVNEKRVPGLSTTVLKDGSPILQKGYGYADLEEKRRVNPQKTIFRTASVSKPIAATALAYAVAKGDITLDTSFHYYVPYFPKKKWDFTIRQLASHTAGIRSYRGKEFALNEPYSIKESIDMFKEDALLFEPGNGYEYNSFDWVLISLAIQEATGIPFQDYVTEQVLIPLGLQQTIAPQQFPRDGPLVGAISPSVESTLEYATWYTKTRLGFREAIPVNNFYKLAGGGFLSTSDDIAKFGQAYLDRIILNKNIVSEFLTSVSINGKPTYYGLGWQVSEDKKGRPYFGHVGSSVGAYSNLFVYPEERMVFSILINSTDSKVQEELDEVINLLIDNFEIS